MHSLRLEVEPQPLGQALWDWQTVHRVLIVRLRSIGDTVLTTPSLFALRRFLPDAQIDILLEEWVAPVLDGYKHIDNIITLKRGSTTARALVARRIRGERYDVVYNLHGGTTATLLTRATGAKHRVGYAHYQYGRLHNHLAPPSSLLWGKTNTHSVEQQLALPGWTGVPVSDRPPTQLAVTDSAAASIKEKLIAAGHQESAAYAVIHPAAAFDTKRWAIGNFAQVVEYLSTRGLASVAIAAPTELEIVSQLKSSSSAPVVSLTDLSLPEVSALTARARLFVGNDSGIAHIAAAVRAPTVVIFRLFKRGPLAALGRVSGRGCARRDGLSTMSRLFLREVRAAGMHSPRTCRARGRSDRSSIERDCLIISDLSWTELGQA